MGKLIDLTGNRYGKLMVLAHTGKDDNRVHFWECLCDCGETHKASGNNLKAGHVTSCGCNMSGNTWNIKHGFSGTTTFNVWSSMKARCSNENHDSYHRYGGRGIEVCDRWLSFENFLADMGERPKWMSIERLDNDGNYDLSNCKWATFVEQCRNKSTNRWITFNGKTMILTDWAKEKGIKLQTLVRRLDNLNWSLEQALNTVDGRKNQARSMT